MSEEEEGSATFDQEYVSQLRNEAGKYRQQVKSLKEDLKEYKGLEAQVQNVRIETELVRRGVQADPNWVSIGEDESPTEAVDHFLEKYPQFTDGTGHIDEPMVKEAVEPLYIPNSMPPNPSKANIPGPPAQGKLGSRSLDEIQQDPMARQTLREVYRDQLRSGSHQIDQDF